MFWNDQIKFNVKKTVHEFQIEIEILKVQICKISTGRFLWTELTAKHNTDVTWIN